MRASCLAEIARALYTTPDYLLGFEEEKDPFEKEAQGLLQSITDEKVRAVFSQPGAKRKFDNKYGERPNVSSKLVEPGNQAVDNQIMQAIEFYCKKCRKSMRISYALTGDRTAPAMNGIMIKCHTHKCTRVVTLRNFTEGQIVESTDAHGKCYL